VTAAPFVAGQDYEIRSGTPDDVPFILDSWRWAALRIARGVEKPTAMSEVTARILAYLKRPGARTKVAASGDALLGWVALEDQARVESEAGPRATACALHFALVRKDFRGMGVARALLAGEAISVYTQRPTEFRGAPRSWTYNPWALTPLGG